jgi:hypothetical protein
MDNFELAKEYGIKMANLTNKGGIVALGLIGSKLNMVRINKLFDEINKSSAVKFIRAKEEGFLIMQKL